MKFTAVLLAALTLSVTTAKADFLDEAGLRKDASVLAPPAVPEPALGEAYVDPVFGTRVRRLSLTPVPGSGTSRAGVIPEYSKAQAWNADGSRLLLRDTDGSTSFVVAHYRPGTNDEVVEAISLRTPPCARTAA